VLILLGVVRSFNGTASRSILPQLVPDEHFANAVAWNATTFQAATILGPSLGGILYALFRGPSAVYGLAMLTAWARCSPCSGSRLAHKRGGVNPSR
jgi:MFS family permease